MWYETTIQRVPRLEVYPNLQDRSVQALPQDFGRATRAHPGGMGTLYGSPVCTDMCSIIP
jgi:hypothetical protein